MAGNKNSGNPNARYLGPTCGAKNKAGNPCRAPAMSNGRCRVHGGATPKGLDSPHWRTGRYSKYVNPKIAPILKDLGEDLNRYSMDEELKLVTARIAQLSGQVGTSESSASWEALAKTMDAFEQAQTIADPKIRNPKMHEALQEIRRLVREGAGESAAWAEMMDVINRRRVIVESEERRLELSKKLIPADQVMNMIASMSRLILDEVTDPDGRRRVHERLMNLAHGHRLPLNKLPTRLLEAPSA